MSSETGKRNPDRLNIIGVVVVGICGAVLVYVSIALLQAFYMNDTAQVEVMADYGGQDTTQRSIKSEQLQHIDPSQGVRNPNGTFSIKIEKAMDLVVRDKAVDPCTEKKEDACPGAGLVPSQGPSTDRTQIQPVYGRPKKIETPAPAPAPAPAGAGSGAAPAGAGSGAPAGAGSAAGGHGP